MNNTVILTSLKRVAIFFAMLGMAGAATALSAQTYDPTPIPSPDPVNVRNDFNGDRQADLVFSNPTSNEWTIQNVDGTSTLVSIGEIGDRPAVADYDGDFIEDVAVVHSKGGTLIWNIQHSSTGKEVQFHWGIDGDTLVQGDYDGDKMADAAVWRSSEGMWYILSSKTGEMIVLHWGDPKDKAMPGDYDGDGVMDVCVFRPRSSSFFFYTSSKDLINEQVFGPFVMSGNEVFIPADYDGDRITDFAMFDATKGGMFVIRESSTGKYNTVNLEGSSPICNPYAPTECGVFDFALVADYDNDGKVDPAMWDSKLDAVSVMGSSKGLMVIPTRTTMDMIPVSSFYMTK